jgi:hypothetical protein
MLEMLPRTRINGKQHEEQQSQQTPVLTLSPPDRYPPFPSLVYLNTIGNARIAATV